MAKSDERLDQQIAMRVSSEDIARLDALAERISVMPRNAIARAALRFGLEALEANPGRIIEQPAPKRGGRRGAVKAR